MSRRKGQSAMEYLMTYGWAILVVMIVGIAMWRLGVFSMSPSTLTFTGFAKMKPQLAGTGLSHDGTMTLVMTNGVGAPIYIKKPGVNMSIQGSYCASDSIGCVDTSLAADCTEFQGCLNGQDCGPIAPGDNFKIVFEGCKPGTAGSVYVADVSINYRVSIGSASTDHTESGSIRGGYE